MTLYAQRTGDPNDHFADAFVAKNFANGNVVSLHYDV